jgi:collagen type I/II/III/V/XI/XXIV/XXVII alpha
MSIVLQQQTFVASDWGEVTISSGIATVTQQFSFAVALTGTLTQGSTVNVVEQNSANTVLNLTCTGTNASDGFILADDSGNDFLFANTALTVNSQMPVTTSGSVITQAAARNLVWTGAQDTNFANAANWDDTTNTLNPASSAPGAADTAQFLTGGGTITGNGTASALQFGGSTLWDVAASASLSAVSSVTVGQSGSASLLINGGASINGLGASDDISGGSGAAASVAVDGAGSAWRSAGELIVGDLGTGGLTVSNGANVTGVATVSLPALVLGAQVGGDGSLAVTGVGSRATLVGQLNVGQAGAGSLIVENQGTAVTGGSTLAPSQGIDVAQAAGGAGNITVAGAQSLLSNTGGFIVGDAGLGGLSIQSGGTVITSPGSVVGLAGAVIANTASASGSSVNVSGAGSNWQVTGSLIVGNAGQGLLNVSQGAVVTAASADLAAGATGDGIISVAGTGSALTLTGSLTVGDQAAGELSVLNGATVSALNVTIGNASAASSGNVDVEGAGSRLRIGAGGSLNIGVAGGGSGVLTVGAGSTLNFTGTIVESGHASFNNNGGVIDPDAVEFTTASNGGTGLNEYDLFVGNIGAVQVSAGTGTWLTPMVLTGTSAADADNNINNNGDTGQWQLSQSGTFIVNANTIDAGQAIVFEDATDTLVIGQVVNGGSAGVSGQVPTIAAGAMNLLQAGGFDAQIWGYQAGDKIDFNNLIVSSDSIVNGNTLDLFDSSNTLLGSLTFFNKAGNKPLALAGMQAAAAQIACFAEGTMIETASGPRRVESLAVGDEVVTLLGGPGRIVWVGSRRVDCERHPKPEAVWPVCITAGAFGENVPARDLFVSPDHAVFINDVLVPARLLINGTSIVQVKRDHVRYYHVELPEHAVIRAEGLTVESYLDSGDRTDFSDGRTIRMFPDFAARPASVTAMMWETAACAELLVGGERLDRIRRRLNRHATHPHSRIPREAVR